MNLPNPMVTELKDLSGQSPYWAIERNALDARFGATGNPPIFRVAAGDLVPRFNSVGGRYAPGLGSGTVITGDRLLLPSDLAKHVVTATRPDQPTQLETLDSLYRIVALSGNGGTLVNEAA